MTTSLVFKTNEKKRLGALLIFAALIRILYLYLYSRQSIWSDIVVDSLYHLNWADSIASGDILGQQTYFRAPLYIYVLAFCRALAPDSLLLPRALGSALGVASIFVTYLLARRSAPGNVGRNIGLAAGTLQALYPSVIFFEAELLVDFLFAFLLQITVYRLLVAHEKNSTTGFVIAGIALGLASLTRPTALALIPLFALFVIYSKRFGDLKSKNYRGALALIVTALIVIAPVTIRNYVVGGDFTLIASSGGVNFFIGNNAESNPISASLPEPYGPNWTLGDMTGLAESYEGRRLSPAEVSHSWAMRAVDWIAHNPVQFISNYTKKLYLALGARTYSNNRSLATIFDSNPVLKFSPLNFSLLLFLALAGVFSLRRSKTLSSAAWPLWAAATAGAYLLIVSLFFISERFRLPSLVLLFPVAGVGAVALWGYVSTKRRRTAKETLRPVELIVAGLITGLSLLPYGRPGDSSLGRAEYLQANKFLSSGQLEESINSFGKLLQLNPEYPRAALNLGVSYFLKAEPDSARYYFERELLRSPENPEALTNLASLALTQQDYTGADSLSAKAYQIRPYDLATLRVRVRALSAVGEYESAGQLLDENEQRFANDSRYWYERMRYYLSLETPDKAASLEALQRGAALDPNDTQPVENSDWAFTRNSSERKQRLEASAMIRYQLGYLAGLGGKYDSAVTYSSEAIALDSTLSAAYVNLTLGYLSLGQIDSARAVYQASIKQFSSDAPASPNGQDLQRLRELMNRIQ